jgi:hypothetical protein
MTPNLVLPPATPAAGVMGAGADAGRLSPPPMEADIGIKYYKISFYDRVLATCSKDSVVTLKVESDETRGDKVATSIDNDDV